MLRLSVILLGIMAYGVLLIVTVIGMKRSTKGALALGLSLCALATACIGLYGLLIKKGIHTMDELKAGGPTSASLKVSPSINPNNINTQPNKLQAISQTTTPSWISVSAPEINVSNISFPGDYLVITPYQEFNSDTVQYPFMELDELRAEVRDNKAISLVATDPEQKTIFLLTGSLGPDDDVEFYNAKWSDFQDSEIDILASEIANSFFESFQETNHSMSTIGSTEYIITNGTHSELDGLREVQLYLSKVGYYIDGLYVDTNDPAFFNEHGDTINQIVSSITYNEFLSSPDIDLTAPSENISNTPQDTQNIIQAHDGDYQLGETWSVPGQWDFTITRVEETPYRNEFNDKNPAAVYYIWYTYENTGYVDQYDSTEGLFFDVSGGSIVDAGGQMGYSYPGDITTFAKRTPVGAYTDGQDCIAVEHAGPFSLTLSHFDGNGEKQIATYQLAPN